MENRRADHLGLAVAACGMTSIAAQIILIREFVSVFQGNELVIGLVLASWMALTAAGAYLGRRSLPLAGHRSLAPAAIMAAGILPCCAAFLVRYMRSALFTAGSMPGISQALIAAVALLAPYCLLSGCLFPFFVHVISLREGRDATGSVYSRESLGSAAGGLLFNIALIAFLDTFQALFVLLLLDLLVAFLVARRDHATSLAAAALTTTAAVCALLWTGAADRWTRKFLFPGQEIVYFRDTPYGNLTVTRQRGQLSFFENTALMFSTNDVIANEEAVHYCLLQRRSPRRVLLLGGGIAGTTREILKYGTWEIDYVEINPWIIDIGRRMTHALDDGRVNTVSDDPRLFLRSTRARYDAALINLPDPGTAQLNRFFTLEFFRDLRRTLNAGAVVSTSLLPSTEYQGTEARRLTSVLFATLRGAFAHVLIIPGERNYFLASDSALDIGIAGLEEERGIPTAYVNRFYLDDRLLAQRSAAIAATIDSASEVNTDFRPVCYYRQVAYWASYFGFSPAPWIIVALAAIALLLARSGPVGAGMFAGGFTASTIEIVLLLSFQALCGSLFQMTGIIITAFMAGLAAGAYSRERIFRTSGMKGFIVVQFLLSGVCFVLPAVLLRLQGVPAPPLLFQTVFASIAFCVALLTGLEFATAAAVRRGQAALVASGLYGLDLVGSALGALAVSAYAIPAFGLVRVSLFAGLVSATGGLVCLAGRKRIRGYQEEASGAIVQ